MNHNNYTVIVATLCFEGFHMRATWFNFAFFQTDCKLTLSPSDETSLHSRNFKARYYVFQGKAYRVNQHKHACYLVDSKLKFLITSSVNQRQWTWVSYLDFVISFRSLVLIVIARLHVTGTARFESGKSTITSGNTPNPYTCKKNFSLKSTTYLLQLWGSVIPYFLRLGP